MGNDPSIENDQLFVYGALLAETVAESLLGITRSALVDIRADLDLPMLVLRAEK